nr:ORF1 [Torque teno felis virus]
MVRYYRRRFWPRRKWWTKRRRGYGRRRKIRRRTFRKRYKVRRFNKRKKSVVTYWNPDSQKKCTIIGYALGITTDPMSTVSRMYDTWWKGEVAQKYLKGGGVALNIFSLKWLWNEHRLYHNFWTNTNDGYDLAKYFGTRWYLPPARDVDYVFWWDTDIGKYDPQDYLRAHPANLLSLKNSIYVRSQKYGKQHKMKHVTIKPPANISSQWKYQADWFNLPLFLWGITLIDWRTWWSKTTNNPLPMVDIQGQQQTTTTQNTSKNFTYAPYIDTGTHNYVDVAWIGSNLPAPTGSNTTWYKVEWANDLPYWMVFWGQNHDMDMNSVPAQTKSTVPNGVAWLRIYWPGYTAAQIMAGQFGGQYLVLVISASDAQKIARSGPFVPGTYTENVQIPVLYRSRWKWGGTVYTGQPVVQMGNTKPALVSVKNPLTLQKNIIYPWDTGPHGILTGTALQRFLQPSTVPDERRPQPGGEYTPWDASSESYSETGEEAEESEKDTDGEEEIGHTLRCLKRNLEREQLKRRGVHKLLKCLVKRPKYEVDKMIE